MKPQHAFSLIEMLITLAIIGIVTALLLPNYQHYMENSYRHQAALELIKRSGDIQQLFFTTHSYPKTIILPQNDHYNYAYVNTFDGFQLSATPHFTDNICGTLIINAIGKKTISGTGTVETCW